MTEQPTVPARRAGKAIAGAAAFPGALLLIGVVLFVDARGITGLAVVGMGPAAFPTWISALLMASSALMLLIEVRRALRGEERTASGDTVQSTSGGSADSRDRWAPLAMAVLFLLYVAAMTAVGFYTATFLFAVAAMSLIVVVSRTSRPLYVLVVRTIPVGLLMTLAVYGAVVAIGMRRPDGGPLL